MTIYFVIDSDGIRAFSDYEKAKLEFDVACSMQEHYEVILRKTEVDLGDAEEIKNWIDD